MTRILLWPTTTTTTAGCTMLLLLTAVTISTQLQQTADASDSSAPRLTGASEPQQRPARFAQHANNGLFGFFDTLRGIRRLYDEQYNDTLATLQSVMNTVGDQFTDTATPKPVKQVKLMVNRTSANNGTTTTAKPEKFRISRQELGYILGRNYRGLRKLFRLELQDAQNQSRANLADYRREIGRAINAKDKKNAGQS